MLIHDVQRRAQRPLAHGPAHPCDRVTRFVLNLLTTTVRLPLHVVAGTAGSQTALALVDLRLWVVVGTLEPTVLRLVVRFGALKEGE